MTHQGRYRVLRKIADGGMAEIFLGTQRGAAGFERQVVLKRIRPALLADEQFRDALIDEAHIAMSLTHSNIAQVLDLGVAGGRTFLVLELVDGWDLDRLLRRAEKAQLPLVPELALHVVVETCRALGFAHSRTRNGTSLGIVHRDVTPHNILISEQGEVKLTDFGIATARTKRGISQLGTVKGKLGFMSPEQASGEVLDARSDLYTLGTTLYLMATGKKPFTAEGDAQNLLAMRRGEFEPPESAFPGIHPEVARLIYRAMKRDPNERYRSAEEMLLDVEQVQRQSLRPAGQTELKRWLLELALADGAVAIGRAPAGELIPQSGVTLVQDDLLPNDSELVLEVPEPSIRRAPASPPPRRFQAPAPAAQSSAPRPNSDEWRRPLPPLVPLLVAAVLGLGGLVWYFGAKPAVEREAPVLQAAAPPVKAPIAPAPSPAQATPPAQPTPPPGLPVEEPAPEEPPSASEGPGVRLYLAHRTPPPPAGEDVVSVQLASSPSGARVQVSGRSYGETPTQVRFTSKLMYEVEFSKAGHAPVKARLYLPRRNGQVIEATLAPR